MIKSLERFIEKKFGTDYDLVSYKNVGKDHFVVLDFGDDEIINLVIRERNGENGNYRITSES